jgi:HlyD family secretion protein
MKKGKKIWIFIVIALLVVVSIGFVAKSRQKKVTEVQTDKVRRQDLVSKVTASGKIQPKKKVDISASIPGKVVKLAVEEGQRVKKGDFLLQIDSAPYDASLANARAALSAARSDLETARVNLKQIDQTYQRKVRMWESNTGLISEQDYEQAKTDYDMQQSRVKASEHQTEQLNANVDRATDDLNKTRVTSPMTGIVVRKAVEEGEVAVIGTMNNAGTVLLTVADLSVMQAELEVDETDVGAVTLGQSADITVDAFPGRKFHGRVTEIGNSPILKTDATNQQATDFKVVVVLDNPDPSLRPGLTADGEIITATRDHCLTVPIQALVIRDITKGDKSKADLPKEEREKEGVFLVRNGKAAFKPVSTGVMGEMDIELKEGLKEGEEVVSGTYQTLRELQDGDALHVMTEKELEKQKEMEKMKS